LVPDVPAYSDLRQKHLLAPGLSPGDVVTLKTTSSVRTPFALGEFWYQTDFAENAVVEDERLEIDLPAGRRVTLQTRHGSGATEEHLEHDGRSIFRWRRSNPSPITYDDAAQLKARFKRPPDVELTTFQSWTEVGRWLDGLIAPQAVADQTVRAKALELTTGKTTPRERLQALYDFVSRQYRYVSLSFGIGRLQPHLAAETLANRFGDCKDKAVLLEALASSVGIPVRLALVPSVREITPEVPSPALFDHVVVVAADGTDEQRWIWLDTTPGLAAFGWLSESLRGKHVLLVSAEPRLVRVPADPPVPAIATVTVDARLTETGTLTARVRHTLRNDRETETRLTLRATPQADRKVLGKALEAADGLDGEVTAFRASDPENTEDPVWMEFETTQPNCVDPSKSSDTLKLPLPSLALTVRNAKDWPAGAPLDLGQPDEVRVSLTLTLPPRFGVRLPVDVTLSRDYLQYKSTYTFEHATLHVERTIRWTAREIPLARQSDYLASVKVLEADGEQGAGLTSAGSTAALGEGSPDELFVAASGAYRAKDYEKAVTFTRRLLDLDPGFKNAWNLLGSAYVGLNDYAKAVPAFQSELQLDAFHKTAHGALGYALQSMGKPDAALPEFLKQVEMTPLEGSAHRALGLAYLPLKRPADATREMEMVLRIDPNDREAHAALAGIKLQDGDVEAAAAHVEQALPSTAGRRISALLAARLMIQGDVGRAEKYAQAGMTGLAAQISLGDVADSLTSTYALGLCWGVFGVTQVESGHAREAEPWLRASWLLTQNSKFGTALGRSYEALGRREDAKQIYRLALAAVPPDKESAARLSKLIGRSVVEDEYARSGNELQALRTVDLGAISDVRGQARFYLLFSSSAATPEVRFADGDQGLKTVEDALRHAHYSSVVFPDATP
jgi:tetratricopeptide (TPR) repeat protein/transglutaminase-like putative cysteine protease